RDDELVYIRPNPSAATPFGLGALEVAFSSIARQLGLMDYQGNVSSNQRPGIAVNVGEVSDQNSLIAMRQYWRNEVEGQGQVPLLGMKQGGILRLYPEGDVALMLGYYELVTKELGAAFDLSPQNFGIERDVNRNTSEVASDRDWDQAIRPCARSL